MTHDEDVSTRTRIWFAALAGAVAVATALGVGEIVAAFVNPRSSPLVAVGGVVIDWVPEAGKELAIRWFGTNNKLALQVGTIVLLLLICAGLGVAAMGGARGPRRSWVGYATFGVLGALAVAAALTRTGAGPAWVLPGIVAAGSGAGLLSWLQRRIDVFAPGRAQPLLDAPTNRRRFLRAASMAVIAGALGGYVARYLAQVVGSSQARDRLRAQLPQPSGRPAASVPGADVAGLTYVTPNDTFYRVDISIVPPRIDPADWSLTIDGRVRRPLRLTMDDLLARPMIERYITLACVSNPVGGPYVGNARWLGVPIADLLDEVDPDPDADQVVGWAADGFTAGTPTAVLRDGRDAMLAVAMNGEPLPFEHGFPVRVVVPGLYGYVSATKWVQRLELTRFADFDAYWIPRGWARFGPVKTASRIDRPRHREVVAPGEQVVAGVAWAQHRGISAVQVRVDGGAWQDATVAAVASVDTWRLWSWRWFAPPGEHVLEVRAADNSGQFQTEQRTGTAPDGATGYHQISVVVR